MKILVANLTNGGLSAGYYKYLKKIIPLLHVNNNVTHMDVFVPSQTTNLRNYVENDWFSWPEEDHKKGFPWLKTRIKEIAPDVVFVPTARWIDCGHIPIVIMIHNMEPLTVPFGGNPWKEIIKNIGRAYMAKKACKRSSRIIAVSQHVKDFLHNQWNIELDKITTIYHGVEIPDKLGIISAPSFLKKENHEQFIFTAGSIRPARGLEDIIHALGILHKNGLNHKLVIAGGIDPGMEKYKHKLERISSKLDIASQIIWAGNLFSSEMSWCYFNCSVFIITSRVEACPNIALEAMANGCLCISTDNPPLPEFFKDAAVYYSQKRPDRLAYRIKDVIDWPEEKRQELRRRASMRASLFRWNKCAEKTILEFKKVIKNADIETCNQMKINTKV